MYYLASLLSAVRTQLGAVMTFKVLYPREISLIAKKEKHHMANIFENARAERAYDKYVRGLESMAGLVETLSGPGPFTLFIPTDAAFDRLSDDQQANLIADPGKLAKVLK